MSQYSGYTTRSSVGAGSPQLPSFSAPQFTLAASTSSEPTPPLASHLRVPTTPHGPGQRMPQHGVVNTPSGRHRRAVSASNYTPHLLTPHLGDAGATYPNQHRPRASSATSFTGNPQMLQAFRDQNAQSFSQMSPTGLFAGQASPSSHHNMLFPHYGLASPTPVKYGQPQGAHYDSFPSTPLSSHSTLSQPSTPSPHIRTPEPLLHHNVKVHSVSTQPGIDVTSWFEFSKETWEELRNSPFAPPPCDANVPLLGTFSNSAEHPPLSPMAHQPRPRLSSTSDSRTVDSVAAQSQQPTKSDGKQNNSLSTANSTAPGSQSANNPILRSPTPRVPSSITFLPQASLPSGAPHAGVDPELFPSQASALVETVKAKIPAGCSQKYRTVQEAAADPQAPPALKAIEEFFSFHPPVLTQGKKHTSDGTKPPQKYDQHFHEQCRLKKVVYCPEILDDLRNLADTYVLRRLSEKRIPDLNATFPTSTMRHKSVHAKNATVMTSEETVVSYYQTTTAVFAPTVAATLYFGHEEWSPGQLEWAQHLVGESAEGIADGFLRFPPRPTAQSGPLKELEKFGDRPIVTWEFKSITSGDEETMTSIMRQAGKSFDWAECKYGFRTIQCRNKHKPRAHATSDYYEVYPRTGPDATGIEVASLWPTALTASEAREWQIPDGVKVTKTTEKDAKYIIQQIWAQATKHDLTLFVLNAGNWEIICRRDRANQKLYLSELIEVSNIDYGRLHTGLYLAGLVDARIRVDLAVQQGMPNLMWTPTKRRGQNTPEARQIKMKSILGEACLRQELLLDIQSNVASEVTFETRFVRPHSTYFRDPASNTAKRQENSASDVLRLQIFKVINASVFLGTLSVDNVTFSGFEGFCQDIVLKVADTEARIDKLREEYHMYCKLLKDERTRGFVPRVIGFFRHPHVSHSQRSYILLQEHVGEKLEVATNRYDRGSLAALRHPFELALSALHDGGYVHGSLSSHHLLVLRGKEPRKSRVSIISFGRGYLTTDETAKAEERAILDKILPTKAGKRGLEDSDDDSERPNKVYSRAGTQSPGPHEPEIAMPELPHEVYIFMQ